MLSTFPDNLVHLFFRFAFCSHQSNIFSGFTTCEHMNLLSSKEPMLYNKQHLQPFMDYLVERLKATSW